MTDQSDQSMQRLLHADTEDFGIEILRRSDGGLVVSVDSRHTYIYSLKGDAEMMARAGDLYHSAVRIIREEGPVVADDFVKGLARMVAEANAGSDPDLLLFPVLRDLRGIAAGVNARKVAGNCRCGHWDARHFDDVLECSECECPRFKENDGVA